MQLLRPLPTVATPSTRALSVTKAGWHSCSLSSPPSQQHTQHTSYACSTHTVNTVSVCREQRISRRRTARQLRCQSSSEDGQQQQGTGSREVPWTFGCQTNERFLQWGPEASTELVRRVLAQKLGDVPLEEVDRRLNELGLLVPDLVGKLARTRADILLKLTTDLPATSQKLLGLRDLFPGINVSMLVSRWPYLLSDYEVPEVSARLQELRQKLPGVRVEALVDLEPQILKVDVDEVLQNIRRILPQSDPIQVLVTQPQMVLDMSQAGQPSSMEVQGVEGVYQD